MANSEHVSILRAGKDAYHAWKAVHPRETLDVRGADLAGVKLAGADLRILDLRDANFTGADLYHTQLSPHVHLATKTVGNLAGGTFLNARLRSADLRDADLTGCNLCQADLGGANLTRAKVAGANFDGARFAMTRLIEIDLSLALHLDRTKHGGPSSIGLDTLALSRGRIAPEFLRGCGLKSWEILGAGLYSPALTHEHLTDLQYRVFQNRMGPPILVGSVFISYAQQDQQFVDRLYEALTEQDLWVWVADRDLVAGDIQRQVTRSIRLNDVVVAVLSKWSLQSDWVEKEVGEAREREKVEKRDVLCPIALDDSWNEKKHDILWRQVTKKYIVDFSQWRSRDMFKNAVAKLTKGIQENYLASAGA